MTIEESLTAGMAAADKIICMSPDNDDLRTLMALAWLTGVAEGGYQALASLQTALTIEKVKA